MTKILVENQYGHGAIHQPLRTFLRRLRRPMVGKSSIPFNWSIGYDAEAKIGVIPTKNQFQADSCGGEAKSYSNAIVSATMAMTPYIEKSAKSIYSQAFSQGGGMTVQQIEQDNGATDESVVSSYINGGCNEVFMELTDWKTPANIPLLNQNKGWIANTINTDIDSIAEAIRDYGAAIWMIEGQNNGSWLATNPQPPTSSNPNPIWRHYLVLTGAMLVNGVKTIKAINSWGDQIGDKGRQYFTENYINSGHIIDIIAFQHQNAVNYKFNQMLWFGMQNNDVLKLQQRLGISPQTGYFGFGTLGAVLKYQQQNGLAIRGWVNAETQNFLNSH